MTGIRTERAADGVRTGTAGGPGLVGALRWAAVIAVLAGAAGSTGCQTQKVSPELTPAAAKAQIDKWREVAEAGLRRNDADTGLAACTCILLLDRNHFWSRRQIDLVDESLFQTRRRGRTGPELGRLGPASEAVQTLIRREVGAARNSIMRTDYASAQTAARRAADQITRNPDMVPTGYRFLLDVVDEFPAIPFNK